MSRIRIKINSPEPESNFDRRLANELLSAWSELAGLLNGGLSLADNMRGEVLTVTDSGSANAENTISHTLKRVPTGFIVININKGGVVYDSGTAWTATALYLKCTVANATIKVFVF